MNHIYRSVWNEALGAWVAVSEISKGQGKRSANRRQQPATANSVESERWAMPTLLTGLLLCSSPSWALPTGDQLVAGQATVSNPNANVMQIDQSSQKAVVNWQGFSVGQNEAVNIHQPNAQAALLNRVVGADASQIQGQINANGQVYLVNPNGVVFSKTAQVDVGGLVATTHNISNADFIAGKNHFTQDGATGTVENHGTINTANGGVVALIGEQVTNTGTINTPKGTTALAAGKTVDLDFKGDGLVEVKVTEAALNAQITNKGAIQADGGRVVLTAKAANSLIDSVINQEGVIRAQGLTERNGEIILDGGYVSQTGTLDASGKTGGKIDINARAILDAGKTNADGSAGNGGNINLKASDAIIQTAEANTHANGTTQGGTVHLEATNSVYSSGKLSATGQQGGTIDVVSSDRVVLAAADVDASGTDQGGLVRIGGDFHGANAKLPNAKTTIVNGATKIKANGGKGRVVIWSNEQTDNYGSISANKAGEIEASSKGLLNYAGRANAGVGGSLLLDPKNIVIVANAGVANYSLIDPHAAANNQFGTNTTVLGTTVGGVFTENGNIAVSSAGDSLAATNAGAVYLFNTTTGALLSALTGSKANDQVGVNGIVALTNGNYVVSSGNWNNGTVTNAGAATWGNGVTGLSGVVSSVNSLVGSSANDFVSGGKGSTITALSNGNYVVGSSQWDNGSGIVNAGAATWGNGATGISGTINSANSLVGTRTSDSVSSGGITALNNGNYVVSSRSWNNGSTASSAGAATWGNGATGISGTINSFNSLVGSSSNDQVSSSGITALTNGNYVVGSRNWSFTASFNNAGAATWGNGATGISGTINTANSLIGNKSNDQVSGNGITALTNGNYVVASSNWGSNFSTANVGAATWGNGTAGVTGVVSSANSLVGSSVNDNVGQNIVALTNGNYVVGSSQWDNASTGTVNAGAATWGNGATGISGVVSSTNSLVGSSTNDSVGSTITALTNGNYVVGSSNWNNGTATRAGAATWGNGVTDIKGAVSSTNSLVGSSANDNVGNTITALTNGNYVVGSSGWRNGTATSAGAATWGNGATGITGAVSSANSLVGSNSNDNVGRNIVALKNGNYVVASPNWFTNGCSGSLGAATWGNGATGIKGAVSSSNSLVGSSYGDNVSNAGIIALNNGNYVVSSGSWKNGTVSNAGATTWGNGTIGRTGVVSTLNSLTGSVLFDFGGGESGGYRVTPLNNGNYVVQSGVWDNNGLVDAGQVRIVTPQNIYFNNGIGQGITMNPSFITETLATGTSVTLQASNDITLNTDVVVSGSTGGKFTMQAGRNINLNGKIRTANGNFTAVAGDPNAVPADREAGTPTITLGAGATIDAGTGKVILAAIGGNFVNNSGSTAPITANQWLVYSTDPRLNSRNGMVADYKHYGQTYTENVTPDYVTAGNWFLYSITPVLTVTPNSQTVAQGGTLGDFSFTLSGFIDGDTRESSGINGSGVFGIENFTGKVGSYNISYLRGLASKLGYAFVDNTASINELTVTPSPTVDTKRNITINNIFNFNFWYSQITTLQVSTTYLDWYHERHAHHDDEVDYDYGQYKGDHHGSRFLSYETRRGHGKKHWHEKRHNNKLKEIYDNLLILIENNGIKLPTGWRFPL
jgi:filamentous hemagglutinin family protein